MKKLIIANWKCNPTSQKQAKALFSALSRGLKGTKAEVVVCPPFVYLPLALEFSCGRKKSKLKVDKSCDRKICQLRLGAQDCFWEKQGAFTGEISPAMLKDLGVRYVILGHSERVMIMQETNEMTAKKVKAALEASLTPIVCIGETIEERKQGKTFLVLEKELKESLQFIKTSQVQNVVIAYEPLWAISPQNPCPPDEALTVALFLRKVIGRLYGRKPSETIRVLYGGNVDSENAKNYVSSEWLGGLLVGGASLSAAEFIKIVKNV